MFIFCSKPQQISISLVYSKVLIMTFRLHMISLLPPSLIHFLAFSPFAHCTTATLSYFPLNIHSPLPWILFPLDVLRARFCTAFRSIADSSLLNSFCWTVCLRCHSHPPLAPSLLYCTQHTIYLFLCLVFLFQDRMSSPMGGGTLFPGPLVEAEKAF